MCYNKNMENKKNKAMTDAQIVAPGMLCELVNRWARNKTNVKVLLTNIQCVEPHLSQERMDSFVKIMPTITGANIPGVLAVDKKGQALIKTVSGFEIHPVDSIFAQYI